MASSFLASTLTRAAARRLAAASTALPRQHARTTVRTLSSALLHSNARLARTTLFPAMTRPRPAMWVPSAGMKIKTSDKASPEAEGAAAAGEPANKKESPKRPEQDAEKDGDQGLDLFAQAAKNQKRRDAEAATAAGGGGGAAGTAAPPPGEGEAAKLEDPVEAERQRKWKQAAEEEERKQMAKSGRNVAITLGLIGLGCFIYLGLPDNEEQQPKEGESYFARYHIRAWDNLKNLRKTLSSPALEKLLPDALPPPYQRPLTLCIELSDALVHLEWDKSVGWRVATRPGVKQFLANLSRYYEVVIFTSSPGYLAEPVCQALDPHFFYAMYRLYRDHTTLVDGTYVKDLSQLNRDLSKTIILDTNKESFQLQPENGILLKPWLGDRSDRELKRLETFFEELYVFISVYGIQDVRPILNIVNTIDPEDAATAWAMYKQRAREDFAARQLADPSSTASSTSKSSWLSRLLGGGAASQQQQQPLNVIDQIEQLAREEHALADKDAENMKLQMVDMQRQQEEFIKKQMEENKKKGLKLWDYFNGAGAPQQPMPPQQ